MIQWTSMQGGGGGFHWSFFTSHDLSSKINRCKGNDSHCSCTHVAKKRSLVSTRAYPGNHLNSREFREPREIAVAIPLVRDSRPDIAAWPAPPPTVPLTCISGNVRWVWFTVFHADTARQCAVSHGCEKENSAGDDGPLSEPQPRVQFAHQCRLSPCLLCQTAAVRKQSLTIPPHCSQCWK